MKDVQYPWTHLFMVRVWREDLGDNKTEWRRQVKYVLSGEARYFRNWNVLTSHIQSMLEIATLKESSSGDDRSE